MRYTVLTILLLAAIGAAVAQLPRNVVVGAYDNVAISFGIKVSPEIDAIAKSSKRWQLDPRMMYAVCEIESGCKRNPRNSGNFGKSSAQGMYQYIEGTWIQELSGYIRKTRIPNIAGLSRGAALNKRFDPYLSAEVFAYQRKSRQGTVARHAQASGLPVGVVHYIDHFLPKMASKLSNKSNYPRSFGSVVGWTYARSNNFQNMSFGQVVHRFATKYINHASKTPKVLLDGSENLIVDDLAAYNTNGEFDAYRGLVTQEQKQQNTKWWQSLFSKSQQQSKPQQSPTPTQQQSTQAQQSAVQESKYQTWLKGRQEQLTQSTEPIVTSVESVGSIDGEVEVTSIDTYQGTDANVTYKKGVDSIPEGVLMQIVYNKGDILWATLGTSSCNIKVYDKESEGTKGRLTIGVPTINGQVVLLCATVYGPAIKYKDIVIQ